jgi:hypothetical protein
MKNILLFIVPLFLFSCSGEKKPVSINNATPGESMQVINNGNPNYHDWFEVATMRLDLYHSGNAKEDHFSYDIALNDGMWSGSLTQLIDPLKRGPYLFEVTDASSDRLLYSRGFASVFGEWQTTPEADTQWGTFSESLRFPWPKKPVNIIISRRNALNEFEQIWHYTVDPKARNVNPSLSKHTEKVNVIHGEGAPAEKVDFVILGDGYSHEEMEKFRKDSKRLSEYLLSTEPFASHKADIVIRSVETPSEPGGVNKPHQGVFRRSSLSVSYGAFDSERYALSFDNKTIRNVASAVPYDFMVIIINERTYGGGGIYNLYTTVAADNKFSEYIMVHEMGHHLAGLADEYYTSSVAYEQQPVTVEPWEPNITALKDPLNLKWKSVVTEGTPLPTPWNKDAFDSYGYEVQHRRDSLRNANVPEETMEALFTEQMETENKYFSTEKYCDAVGAFEGAGYMQHGLYRPQVDCIMFTRHQQFCKVCQKAINDVFDLYTK